MVTMIIGIVIVRFFFVRGGIAFATARFTTAVSCNRSGCVSDCVQDALNFRWACSAASRWEMRGRIEKGGEEDDGWVGFLIGVNGENEEVV